jgi:glutamate--cysteine ligase catalytic subunit
MVVQLDPETQTARLSLQAEEALARLSEQQAHPLPGVDAASGSVSAWHPEYGRYMIEGTPGAPYGARLKDLLSVYPSMTAR